MRKQRGIRLGVVIALVAMPLVAIQPAALAAPVVSATLVQAIKTWQWSPASPDPAGVTYLPGADRFYVVDSEVEETTGAGFHDVNLWKFTSAGAVQDTGLTTSYTNEPTGLGFDPATGRMFIASDSGEKVFIVKPGSDGRYGTSDDPRTTFLAAGFGSVDTEDVAFNTKNGHLYIADGTAIEVIDVNPVNGTFGDGDDTSTHFDMAQFGGKDTEGIGYDAVRDTLVVADRTTRALYEVTASGTLVQTITLTGISGLRNPADVEIAPSSTGSGRTYWVVDREIDNGPDPTENDGMLFEVSIPSGADAPPQATLTAPAEGATVAGTVNLSATASDDEGVTKVDFLVDGTVVDTDTSGGGGWTGTWDSTAVGDGAHTVTARATDTVGQTASDASAVVVDNVDEPPTVTLTAPAEGAPVGGSTILTATASDDHGVTQVAFEVDGTEVGVDTDGTDGWSVPWDSTSVGDGAHTVSAVASDAKPQTAGDTNDVTVDNSTPSVTITAPAEGATVIGAISISVTADDAGGVGVSSVAFFREGVSLGTDANGADGWSLSWNSVGTSNGAHTLTAVATDAAGNQATSAGVGVTVDNPPVVDIRITASSDDAEQKSNRNVVLNSTDLDMTTDGGTVLAANGLRFPGVQVPAGATIVEAYVQFTTDEAWSTTTSLVVAGQAADDAATFATAKNDVLGRPKTVATVAWADVPAWVKVGDAGLAQRTPNLAPIVQEIVDRTGWSAGNALAFVITGSGRRVARAFDYAAAEAPLLHIEYDIP